MTILTYAASSAETSGTDMSSWIAKLQEGKKSLTQMQQEMLESTVQSIDINKLDDINENLSIDEEDEDNGSEEIQEPSEVTREQLQSPIDLKI